MPMVPDQLAGIAQDDSGPETEDEAIEPAWKPIEAIEPEQGSNEAVEAIQDAVEAVAPEQEVIEVAEPETAAIGPAEPSELDYEIETWQEQSRLTRHRRRNKFIRFAILETLAFGILLIAIRLEVQERFSNNSLSLFYAILVLFAAILVAIIPVLFYALPPTLPPGRR
jgi:hypothetical protein